MEQAVAPGESIGNRYRVERLIDVGGTSAIYAVVDERTGTRLALKQLLPARAAHRYVSALFQREYNTLAQLSHPLIIRAFDYGVFRDLPYYTMELLSGENLRALAPLPPREACALLRDVASALAIVHSRRLVHRDVTPRNVCRTPDGRAKLLDFGALAPMGKHPDIVGTPPFTAPESLEQRALDARTDLFALGATAYFLLTGRHAYPAARLSDLGECWNRALRPPSTLAPDVPEALDDLVLSLLNLNPLARPAFAAEVFDRLTAIAELPLVEVLGVPEAYLSTPSLVGRDEPLGRLRRALTRAMRGRGSSLLVAGAAGLGRSRLLGNFMLEAKLRGMPTVRADAKHVKHGPFAVAVELARRLVEVDPEAATRIPSSAAGNAIASILQGSDVTQALDGAAWPELVEAVPEWMIREANAKTLVVGIDDLEACDEPSAAILLRLADAAPRTALVVAATVESGSSSVFVERLRRSSFAFALRPMSSGETQTVLASIFSDAPNIETVARWVHDLSAGVPRTSLELAQALVDGGLARYEQGTWILPATFEGLRLPQSLDEALNTRIAALSPNARTLAETLSLVTDHDPLEISEYPALMPDSDSATLFSSLNELVASSLLVKSGDAYVFAHKRLALTVRSGLTDARRSDIHRRLARAYDSGPMRVSILAAYHLFEAGECAAAFEQLTASFSERTTQSHRGAGFSRSAEGVSFYEALFAWGEENGLSAAALAPLRRGMLQLASVTDTRLTRHAPRILEVLRQDTGLVHWNQFEDITDPAARVQRCLGEAFARYEATPEDQRGLHPFQAIQELATAVILLTGAYVRDCEAPKVVDLANTIAPLRAISPAVDVIGEIAAYSADAMRGQFVRDRRLRVLDSLSGPVEGFDDLSRTGTLMTTLYYLALEEASHGIDGAAARVAPLEEYPHYAPLAWQVRMIVHLYGGEDDKADACRKQRDLAATGRRDVDRHIEVSTLYEAFAYATVRDLLGLKRLLPTLEARANQSPGWRPYHHQYNGDYLAIRGDRLRACDEYTRAHELARAPDVHGAWGASLWKLGENLIELGSFERAALLLRDGVKKISSYPLSPLYACTIHLVLAHAEACLGATTEAMERARKAVRTMEDLGITGVPLLAAYAREAKVALRAGDRASFDAIAQRIHARSKSLKSVAFASQYAALVQQSSVAGRFESVPSREAQLAVLDPHTTLAEGIRTELELCRGADERARRALKLLQDYSSASIAFLYLCQDDCLTLAASSAETQPPSGLEERLAEWLSRAFDTDENDTTAVVDEDGSEEEYYGLRRVLIMGKRDGRDVVAAVAALRATDHAVPGIILQAIGDGLLHSGDSAGFRMTC